MRVARMLGILAGLLAGLAFGASEAGMLAYIAFIGFVAVARFLWGDDPPKRIFLEATAEASLAVFVAMLAFAH